MKLLRTLLFLLAIPCFNNLSSATSPTFVFFKNSPSFNELYGKYLFDVLADEQLNMSDANYTLTLSEMISVLQSFSGKLSLSIKDSDGLPVSGAWIRLSAGGKTVLSGASLQDGSADFRLPQYNYSLEVLKTGYFGHKSQVETLANQTITLDVSLGKTILNPGDTMFFAVNASGYLNLSEVYILLSLPNESYEKVFLSLDENGFYSAQYTVPRLLGNYSVGVRANYSNGSVTNLGYEDYWIQVKDTHAPVFHSVSFDPPVTTPGNSSILSINVSDNYALSEILLKATLPNGSVENNMPFFSQGLFFHEFANTSEGNYLVFLSANDSEGNQITLNDSFASSPLAPVSLSFKWANDSNVSTILKVLTSDTSRLQYSSPLPLPSNLSLPIHGYDIAVELGNVSLVFGNASNLSFSAAFRDQVVAGGRTDEPENTVFYRVFSINVSEQKYLGAKIIFDYGAFDVGNTSMLAVYYCGNYDHGTDRCVSQWEELGSEINESSEKVSAYKNSTSGFALAEKLVPPQNPGGGSSGGGAAGSRQNESVLEETSVNESVENPLANESSETKTGVAENLGEKEPAVGETQKQQGLSEAENRAGLSKTQTGFWFYAGLALLIWLFLVSRKALFSTLRGWF